MTNLARFSAAAAAIGGLAIPAAAQTPYPYSQPYPQTYPGYQQPYSGYQQPYGQNVVGQVIDQLLGNRYNVTDRQAIRQCATAAVNQAAAQYPPNAYGYNGQGYNGQAYGGHGYRNGYTAPRVTAITDVQRRANGLRVSGTLDSRGGYGHHDHNNGYNNGYATQGFAAGGGDLTFRCNVDYRGAVTNVRVRRNNNRY